MSGNDATRKSEHKIDFPDLMVKWRIVITAYLHSKDPNFIIVRYFTQGGLY